MRRVTRWMPWLTALLLGGVPAVALAQGARKLPADYALRTSDGSPGKVTFSHSSHVDRKRPSCLDCHPGNFRILEAGKTTSGEPIRHAEMEKGRQCGACHGRTAFGFDRCDSCHGG